MYYDDLPVWGFIGKLEKLVKTGVRKEYLFTHFHFEISFNGDKVIEINVSSDPVVSHFPNPKRFCFMCGMPCSL